MVLSISLLVGSCCPLRTNLQWVNPREIPNEDKAIDIVWAVYWDYADEAPNLRSPPIIEWVDGLTFNCTQPSPFTWCYGEYISRVHLARVAWPKGNVKFSRTAMAHELCHAYFGNSHDICNDDLPPVETANAKLRELGL